MLNPKWVAFLAERGLTHQDAESMDRQARINLNADYLCRPLPKRTPVVVEIYQGEWR